MYTKATFILATSALLLIGVFLRTPQTFSAAGLGARTAAPSLATPVGQTQAQSNESGTYTEDLSAYTHKAYTQEADWNVFEQQLSVVPLSSGLNQEPAIAPDGQGGSYVAWADLRNNDADGNWDVYAQRTDERGNRLWSADVRVNSDSVGHYQHFPSIVTDSQGNAVIVWADDRDAHRGIYAQKIAPDGTKVWANDVRINGSPAYRAGWDRDGVAIAIDEQDNVIVAWHGRWNESADTNIYVQKIDAAGARQWNEDVQVNADVGQDQRFVGIDVDTHGNIVIAWVDDRNGGEDIYAQRLNVDGERQWSTDVRVNAGTGVTRQGNPSVVIDSQGNAAIVWRSGPAKPPVDWDVSTIYAQKVDTAGALLWSGNVQVNQDTTQAYKGRPRAVPAPDDAVLVLWEDNREGYSNNDLFAQQVSAAGEIRWPEDRPISPEEWWGQRQLDVGYRAGRAYVVWSKWGDMHVQFFDVTADELVLPVPARVNESDGKATQYDADVTTLSDGRALVVWSDSRRNVWDVRGRAITADGQMAWPSSFQINDSTDDGPVQWRPQVATNANDNSLVVWNDDRGGIRGQLVDETGTRLWTADRRINVHDHWALYPSVVALSDNSFVVAWIGQRASDDTVWDIYLQRIDESGTRQWSSDKRVNAGTYYIHQVDARSRPDIIVDAQGHFVLAWRGDTGDAVDLYVHRVSPDGTPAWAQEQALNAEVPDLPGTDIPVRAVADEEITLAWPSTRDDRSGLYARRLGLDGEARWERRVSSTTAEVFYGNPDLALTQNGDVFVTWDDERSARNVFAQRLSSDGTLVWPEATQLNGTGAWPVHPSISKEYDGSFIVAWHDGRYGDDSIYAQRVTADGTVLWDADVPLIAAESFYYPRGVVESVTVDETDQNISQASLSVDQSLNGGRVDYYLSNDGGQTWEDVVPGQLHSFEGAGSDLRWKAVLHASSGRERTPVIRDLTIRYGADIEGDAFEPDDTCVQARTVVTDGTVQERSFHDQADTDWVTFDAAADTTYLIRAQIPSDSDADVSLELYDRCDSTPQESQDYTFAPGVRMEYTPITDTRLYLKLQNNDPSLFGADVRYDLSVRAPNTEDTVGAVVLVAGRLRTDDHLQDQIHNIAADMYQVFKNHGYTDERIYYLATDLSVDANDDGSPDVDALASHGNLQYAITQWAVETLDPNQPFTLFMVDHGEYDELYLDRPRGEQVSPGEIDNWLTHLEDAVPNVTVNVLIEACKSGSFIDNPDTLSGSGRVVIASTGGRRDAWASDDGAVFSDHFTEALRQRKSLYESFQTARWAAREAHPRQTPWLDDDGDGVPNESEDGQEAQRRGFGYPSTLCAGFEQTGTGCTVQWPPYIVWAEGPDEIAGSRGVIEAEVRDDMGVQNVWAVVYKPSYQPPEDSTKLVQEDLPTVLLLDQDDDGVYSAVYEGFDEMGEYRIVVQAFDETGLEGRPRAVTVRTGWANYLPAVLR